MNAFDFCKELHLYSKSLANLQFYQINKRINNQWLTLIILQKGLLDNLEGQQTEVFFVTLE